VLSSNGTINPIKLDRWNYSGRISLVAANFANNASTNRAAGTPSRPQQSATANETNNPSRFVNHFWSGELRQARERSGAEQRAIRKRRAAAAAIST